MCRPVRHSYAVAWMSALHWTPTMPCECGDPNIEQDPPHRLKMGVAQAVVKRSQDVRLPEAARRTAKHLG